jgi:small basic protein (TIGR04137 family)
MSIHRSLRGIDTLKGERSVLTRFERVKKMLADGRLDSQSQSPYGLPKMRTKFRVAGGKKPKAAAAEAAADPKAAAAPADKAKKK